MSDAKPKPLDTDIRELAPWFHNLHLPDGTETAPDHFLGDFPSFKWREIAGCIPADLSGWSALDIGCNAGFYSFELARRGARVLGIDCDSHYLDQADWAAGQFGLRHLVEFRQMQVYDLARLNGKFDLVLFMGVFYHLRYPMLALDIVAQKTAGMLLFQTITMPGREVAGQHDFWINERDSLLQPGWPKMAFIEERFAGDPTNWWIANHACVEAMLRSAGLAVTDRPGDECYLCEPDPANPACIATWNRSEYLSATNAGR